VDSNGLRYRQFSGSALPTHGVCPGSTASSHGGCHGDTKSSCLVGQRSGFQLDWASESRHSEYCRGKLQFQTSFDLTGFVYSNAVLTLSVGVDNNLNDILVNGVSTGVSYAGFAGFSPNFVLTNSFVPGTNVIDFLTSNAGTTPNPGGSGSGSLGSLRKRLRLNSLLSSSPITYYSGNRLC